MRLGDLKIGVRLFLGISMIIVLTILAGLLSTRSMVELSGLTEKLFNHPYTVSSAILRVHTNIIKMHRTMKDVTLARSDTSLEEAVAEIAAREQDVYRDLEIVHQRFLGEKERVEEARELFANWKPIREEVVALMRQGRQEEAAAITRGRGAEHVQTLEESVAGFVSFAQGKAETFLNNARASRRDTLNKVYWAMALAVAASIILGTILCISITAPLKRLVALSGRVAAGDLTDRLAMKRRDEIGTLANAFDEVIVSLQKVTTQANEIAAGNLDVLAVPRSEKDQLGLALKRMTERLRDVASVARRIAGGELEVRLERYGDRDVFCAALEEMLATLKDISSRADAIARGDHSSPVQLRSENDRLGLAIRSMAEQLERSAWINQGRIGLNHAMRGQQDLEELADRIVRFLAKYLGAQLGVLYVADEESGELKFYGSYALSDQGSIGHVLAPGESLAGQAALEQKMITVSELPDHYFRVRATSCEVLPRSVTITPFVHDGKVTGVIELASLQAFSAREREFLVLVMEDVAISVSAVQARTRMAELLASE